MTLNPGTATTKLGTTSVAALVVSTVEDGSSTARDGERAWMRSGKCAFWTLLLLAGPYYLNDFANIYVSDWRLWLLIDYLILKLLPGLYLCWLLRRRLLSAAELGLRTQTLGAFLVTGVLLSLLAVLIDQNGYQLLAGMPGYRPLGAIPLITDPLWNWIDLTLGLLAVGCFEELVFRGYLYHVISRYVSPRPAVILALSAVAFSLIHWSHGLHTVLVTALIGALFMAVYLRTRSLYALILAHFVVNFVDYSGLWPRAWFRFF